MLENSEIPLELHAILEQLNQLAVSNRDLPFDQKKVLLEIAVLADRLADYPPSFYAAPSRYLRPQLYGRVEPVFALKAQISVLRQMLASGSLTPRDKISKHAAERVLKGMKEALAKVEDGYRLSQRPYAILIDLAAAALIATGLTYMVRAVLILVGAW